MDNHSIKNTPTFQWCLCRSIVLLLISASY
jgi:hypothetical protein